VNEEWQIQVCDVCKLLDNDLTLKECYYCGTCKAWICRSDQTALGRRARAMIKRKIGCKTCGKKKAKSVLAYDPLTKKSIGEMSHQERLALARRLGTE
jgi:hypothetical protein